MIKRKCKGIRNKAMFGKNMALHKKMDKKGKQKHS
jgi:hypothetical protein